MDRFSAGLIVEACEQTIWLGDEKLLIGMQVLESKLIFEGQAQGIVQGIVELRARVGCLADPGCLPKAIRIPIHDFA